MRIAPSVLASDYSNLRQEMERVRTADFIHLDIMDGHFVPNISFGPDLVAALRPTTTVPFDVHLMVSHPLFFTECFALAGADLICFHIESEDEPRAVIEKITSLKKKPAIAIKPDTPVEELYPYCDSLYMVLVMTVEPGFGGQPMREEQLLKVRALKERFPKLLIEVDGGIGRDNIAACAEAGVDICVAGTSIFKSDCPKEEIRILQAAGQ